MTTGDGSVTPLGDQPTVDGQRRRPPARAASRIGRFSVLRRIGAGGMGEVFAAYDEQLDRKVAIKLVAPYVSEGSQGRVRREAQAMARVDHPNVLRVHEAGEHDGQTFIAMEFVDGLDLRAWLRAEPRTWEEILTVYLQAGRGLAAAHEAGLVHRDFKPDNAMVDAAPPLRVRVLDFGLAGRPGDEPLETDTAEEYGRSDSFSNRLTRTGDVMGTPAYMAPEQIAGEAATAQADQFSFCVALWEALYGRRPYGEPESISQLFTDVLDGKREAPAKGSKVPARVQAVLERGLARHADARWPNMNALLAALARNNRARARSAAVTAVAVLAIGGSVAAGRTLAAPPVRCDAVDAELDDVWNDARRAEVRERLVASARAPVDSLLTGLDTYASDWRQARRAACEATRTGAQTEAVALARGRCLRTRREQLDSLVAVVVDGAHPTTVEDALESVDALPRLTACGDLDYLAQAVPPPDDPTTQRQVDEIRSSLARAWIVARGSSARTDAVRSMYDDAVAEAEAIGYEPLLVDAYVKLALIESNAGDHESAMKHALAAYERMDASSAPTQASVLSTLAMLHTLGGDLDLGLAEARRGVALVERALGPDSPELLSSLRQVAHAHKLSGDFQAALDVRLRIEAIANASPDTSDLTRSSIELDLGVAYDDLRDLPKSLAHYNRALALRIDVFGEDSVHVAMVFANRGVAQLHAGNQVEAQADMERALAIRRAQLPADHPLISEALNNLATILHNRGELDRSARLYEEALEIRERVSGPDHVEVAYVLHNYGALLFARRDLQGAVDALRRAERIRSSALDDDNRLLAKTRENLATALLALGEFSEAESFASAAVAGLDARHGEASTESAPARRLWGDIACASGRFAEARRIYRAASSARDETDWRLQIEGRLALVDFAERHFERAAPAFARQFDALADAHYLPGNVARLAAAWAIAAHRTGDDEATLRARQVLDDVTDADDPLRELVGAIVEGTQPDEDLADRLRAASHWTFAPLAER